MAVGLALFLLGQGVHVKDVTILGAYLGQIKILRQKLKDARLKYPHLFGITEDTVYVQTIDLFQVWADTINLSIQFYK